MLSVRFLTPADVRVHPRPPEGVRRGCCYQLIAPLRVQIGDTELLEIPAAFYSDGGSVPAPLWSLLRITPTDPRFFRSFLLHDFSYMVGYRDSRLICDCLLLAGAEADGACRCAREAVYAGVRLGGWVAWGRYRTQSNFELQKSLTGLHAAPQLRLTVAGWNRNLDGLS
jgi:hypothetical protein